MTRLRRTSPIFPALGVLALLAGCARIIPEGAAPGPLPPAPAPSPVAVGATAAQLGTVRMASSALNSVDATDAAEAFDAFRLSCRVAMSRTDVSGLTRLSDWAAPCNAAAQWSRADAASFFAQHFTPVQVGDGKAFATGYFEPEIGGSRTRRAANDVPVYAIPEDLTRCWRDGTAESEREGRAPLGRINANRQCVDYFTRAEIEDGALEGRAQVIGYASDAVEFFFLQIQGSGRLRAPGGEVIRIGYAGQNGHGYTGIGALMRTRGLIGGDTGYATSMQGIMQYLRDYPAEGRAIMRENESWIFFRELTGDGPLGSIGVPVRGRSSVAVDPKFVPYGAPVLLDLDRREADGLWVAQDTGGAIRGANRFDTFWGAGAEARLIAGGMSGRGQALVLLPTPAAARLSQ